MPKKVNKFKKYNSKLLYRFRYFMLIQILIIIFVLVNSNIVVASSYIPAAPIGDTSGYLKYDYDYVVYTTDAGSFWIFDWGDGTYSNWIEVEESDTFISQSHIWASPGVYNVKVKHLSKYQVESPWSDALSVTIYSDADDDGWADEIEIYYGTSYTDPDEYPSDYDGDYIPDASDEDDDNDGISDDVEAIFNSDSKNADDAKEIWLEGAVCFLVDTSDDGNNNLFYNKDSGVYSVVEINSDNNILIDFNGDGQWNYVYNPTNKAFTIYVAQTSFFDSYLLYILVAIVIITICIVVALFKTGILYFYEEEIIGDE